MGGAGALKRRNEVGEIVPWCLSRWDKMSVVCRKEENEETGAEGEERRRQRREKPGTSVWGPSSGRRSLWHGLVSVHLVQRSVTSRKGVHSEGGTIGGCGSVTALGSWCVGCSRVEAELAV